MFDRHATQADRLGHDDAPLRRLGHAEVLSAAAFVAALPEQVRYRRFHRSMSPAMVHDHYEALDWNTAILLAWSEGGEILGIAELHLYDAPDCLEAEIALTLKPDAGPIGLPLMASALSRAAAAGTRRSRMLLCPPDPDQDGICRHLGARFDVAHDTFVFTH